MRKTKVLISITVVLLLCSCRNDSRVYICTGPQSEVYHRADDCMGLNRCTGEIKALTRQDAEKLGRRKCGICYE